MNRPIRLFSVKIATWASEITLRAYDAEDAVQLTHILFEIPTNVVITTIPKEKEK